MAGTLNIPLTTLPVGVQDSGPAAIADADTGVRLTIDRTVSGGHDHRIIRRRGQDADHLLGGIMAISFNQVNAGDFVLAQGLHPDAIPGDSVQGVVLRELTSDEITANYFGGFWPVPDRAVWVQAASNYGQFIAVSEPQVLALIRASQTAHDDLGPYVGLAS